MKKLYMKLDVSQLSNEQLLDLKHKLKITVFYHKSDALLNLVEIANSDKIEELKRFSIIMTKKLDDASNRNAKLDWMLSIIKEMLEDPTWNPNEDFLKDFFGNRPTRL